MRILFLNYEFPPLGGGAANANFYLFKELAKKKNLQIDLITSSTNTAKKETFSKNITIHYLDIGKKGENLHKQSALELMKYYFKAMKLTKKLISQKNYTLLQTFFGIPCGSIALKTKLPYVVSLRGSDVPGHNPRLKFHYKILKRHIKKVWLKANAVVANSEDLRNTALKSRSNLGIKIIKNGVDTEIFHPPLKKNYSKIKCIYVGRFHEIKGLKYILKAFRELGEKDFSLSLVGTGPLWEEYKNKYAGSNIEFLGRKSQEEIAKLYRAHNCYISASLNEGMSNTILEAAASGLAIIGTNTGGIREVLGKDFIEIKKKSSTSIKSALDKLSKNPECLETLQKCSRANALKLSWAKCADEYFNLWKNAIEDKKETK